MAWGDLAHLDHGGEGAAYLGHLLWASIERHYGGATARGLECMAAEPTAEIEHQVPGPDAQPVVVDGQHQAAPVANGVSGPSTTANGAPGSGSPAITAS